MLTVRDIINDHFVDGQCFIVVEQNDTRLNLIANSSSTYDLNIKVMSCSCRLWQKSGIPCAHACRGIQLNMGNVEEYVDNMMFVSNFWSMYAPSILELPKEHALKWHAGEIVLPSMTQRLEVVSAKGSNEIAANTVNQRTAIHSHSATNNLQVHIVL
ncbi:hypothetical protein AB3S75_009802 [Citrus x aurantiifolia]